MTDQITDLQAKLKAAEMGLYGRGAAEKPEDDSGLAKAVRSSNRIAVEGQLGLISQMAKDALFNWKGCTDHDHNNDHNKISTCANNVSQLSTEPMQM